MEIEKTISFFINSVLYPQSDGWTIFAALKQPIIEFTGHLISRAKSDPDWNGKPRRGG